MFARLHSAWQSDNILKICIFNKLSTTKREFWIDFTTNISQITSKWNFFSFVIGCEVRNVKTIVQISSFNHKISINIISKRIVTFFVKSDCDTNNTSRSEIGGCFISTSIITSIMSSVATCHTSAVWSPSLGNWNWLCLTRIYCRTCGQRNARNNSFWNCESSWFGTCEVGICLCSHCHSCLTNYGVVIILHIIFACKKNCVASLNFTDSHFNFLTRVSHHVFKKRNRRNGCFLDCEVFGKCASVISSCTQSQNTLTCVYIWRISRIEIGNINLSFSVKNGESWSFCCAVIG